MIICLLFILIIQLLLVQCQVNLNDDCNCAVSVNDQSDTMDAGTEKIPFTSDTNDPLGPFMTSPESVIFYGVDNGGTTLVYDYLIECSFPCRITNVEISGGAFLQAVFVFVTGSGDVYQQQEAAGSNTESTFDIDSSATEEYATSFRLFEMSRNPGWRYRSSIVLTTERMPTSQPTTNQPTTNPSVNPSATPTTNPSA
eukprot:397981_1